MWKQRSERLALIALTAILATMLLSWDALAQRFGARGRGVAVGPRGGVGVGGYRAGAVNTPFGSAVGGARGGTFVTPGGSTIRAGSVGGVGVGPGGRVTAGGARGVAVTTPNGRTFATGSRGGISTGPGGTIAGGSRGGMIAGPGGVIAGGSRGGIGIGPGGGVIAGGSRGGIAVGPGGGVIAGGSRGVVAGYPGVGLSRYTAGGAAFRGGVYGTRYWSSSGFRTQAFGVRSGFVHYNAFSVGWARGRVGFWQPTRWVVPSVWTPIGWPVLVPWLGFGPTVFPIYVDYGTTVVYRDNYVYVNGAPTVTQAEYFEEATNIADVGRTARVSDTDDWRPLGVFAIVQGEETASNLVFQLGINRSGIIRGNYYDGLSDTTLTVFGSVDKKSQRATWTVGERKDVVYETSIANLTKGETSMLVHFGKDRTQQWSLVRLEEPK